MFPNNEPRNSVGVLRGYGRGSIPGARHFYILRSIKIGSGAQPASYAMGNGVSFLERKVAGA
jgi:hypothetical protein